MARNDRQLIIYPEGTRRAPGDEPAYKYGIVELYAQLGLPVVPVAHVAGLYWPRRKFLRYPGTIKARFLPPIPPGLDKEEFMRRLIAETEAACDAVAGRGGRGSPNPPPLPPTAVKRLKELGQRRTSPPDTASSATVCRSLRLQRSPVEFRDIGSAELQRTARIRLSICSTSWRWRSAR